MIDTGNLQKIQPQFISPLLALQKPLECINTFIDKLKPHAHQLMLPATEKLRLRDKEIHYCYLLLDGTATICRLADELTIFHVTAPMVLGLGDLVFPKNLYFIRAQTDINFSLVPEDLALSCLAEYNLWPQLTRIQAFVIQNFALRDSLLTGLSTYDIIRNQLCMLLNEPPTIRSAISVSRYIIERTQLSRSKVMDVLSQLRHGGYIVMEKGMLIAVEHLPARY